MGGPQTVQGLVPVGIDFPKCRCLSESTPAAVDYGSRASRRNNLLSSCLTNQPGAQLCGLLPLLLELVTKGVLVPVCLPFHGETWAIQ